MIPIRHYNGEYQIEADEDDDGSKEWINLEELESRSSKHDNGRLYTYFLAFLELASHLCYQRNYKGIAQLESFFSTEIVYGCARSENLPWAMRARFTKLLLHLHVDKDPLEPIHLPNLTRNWDKVPMEPDTITLPTKNQISQLLQVLTNFVTDYLRSCNGIQKAYEKEKNEMTLAVLNLSEALIKYGFYKTEDELIAMIDPMITLLDGSKDITNEDEEYAADISMAAPSGSLSPSKSRIG